MQLSGYFRLSLSCLLFSLLFTANGEATTTIFNESSKEFHQNQLSFETNYRYFFSEANYTSEGGQYISLASGNRYQVSDIDLGMRWTTGSTWGFYTSGRLSQAESKTNGVTRTNSNLSQLMLGIDMLMISNSKFDLIPDLSLILPMQRVEKSADEVLTAEGATQITPRLIGRLKMGKLRPFASVGFAYRDEGRSMLLPYSAGAELKLSNIYFGADLSGYQTIIRDQYTNNPGERHIVSARNGGSLKYYSVDPDLVETSAWIKWKGSTWSFHGGAATTVTGANTASGTTFFAGFSFALSPNSRKAVSPTLEPIKHTDDEVQKFEETVNDGVDQNLFIKRAPPKPVRRPDPAQQKLRMQNELDQTEMQIELKKTSKKKRKK